MYNLGINCIIDAVCNLVYYVIQMGTVNKYTQW